MINAYEKAGGAEYLDNTPVALAMRWLDAAEAQIEGDETVEDKDSWYRMLDRVETIAKVDPPTLLQLADMQRVAEEAPPELEAITFGNIVQLAMMIHGLNERAQLVEGTFSAGDLSRQ